MFIIEISPLLAIPRHQDQFFSYFSEQPLPVGSLVEILIGRQKTIGIVFHSRSLQDVKITLRKGQDFTLKPISKIVTDKPIISAFHLRLALWLSSRYFAPLGLCLKTVLPPFFNKKPYPPLVSPDRSDKQTGNFKELLLPTVNLENHYKDYEALLKSNKNKQILLVVPEVTYLDYFLKHYNHLNPLIVHSGLANQNLYNLHKKAASGDPALFISTRTGAFLPFSNLGLVIVDNESNDTSRSDTTPRYDTTELLTFLAKEHGATLVINDLIPRPEVIYRHPAPPLVNGKKKPAFVNMIEEMKQQNFSIFSQELQKEIIETANHQEKTILFLPRKGYAHGLICKACSEMIKCPQCSTALVVHELANNQKILRCHRCRHQQEFMKVCPRCHNFMLEYSGLAIQKVIKKTSELFSRSNQKLPLILELSHDTAPRQQDEESIIRQFQASSTAVLVATQKILSWQYLLKSDLMGIINADLSTIFPDFRTAEKALRQLATLSQMAQTVIVQGYNPDSPCLPYFLKNDWAGFLTEELDARKVFAYPPFAELVKITFRHKNPVFLKEAAILAEKIRREVINRRWDKAVELIGPQAAFTAKEKGLYAWNIFLKIKNLDLTKRNALLRLVPSKNWRIDINPRESL